MDKTEYSTVTSTITFRTSAKSVNLSLLHKQFLGAFWARPRKIFRQWIIVEVLTLWNHHPIPYSSNLRPEIIKTLHFIWCFNLLDIVAMGGEAASTAPCTHLFGTVFNYG